MDGSATRRGVASVSRRLRGGGTTRAGGAAKRGRFGEGHRRPRRWTSPMCTPIASWAAGRRLTPSRSGNELRVELNVGQYLDMVGNRARGHRPDGAPAGLPATSRGSTRSNVPLHVGAAIAGRFDDLAAPLSAYGDPLGEAFPTPRRPTRRPSVTNPRPASRSADDLREGKTHPTPRDREPAGRRRRRPRFLSLVGSPAARRARDIAALQDVLVRHRRSERGRRVH